MDLLSKEILDIPDFRTFCFNSQVDSKTQLVDLTKSQMDAWGSTSTQSLYTIALAQKDQDLKFSAPAFLQHQSEFSPFLRIDMVYEGEGLRFRDSEDMVKGEFMDLVRTMIVSFDKFLHPRFTKVEVQAAVQAKKSMKLGLFNFEADMGVLVKEEYDAFYRSYWSGTSIQEK